MEPNNELTLAQKVKAVGTMTLVTVVLLASAVGYTSYQRNAKVEAAALLQKQIAAVMAKKAILPLFRETVYFKALQETKMVKVNQSSLPATITAGLDETVSPNPSCEAGRPESPAPGPWHITKVGEGEVASNLTKNGWDFTAGGNVSIPSSATYGKYTLINDSNDTCTTGSAEAGLSTYYYVFKIVPPCPTGGTPSSSR